MALASGTRLGAYEILTLIGVGGMGEVYRARDARLNRDVATGTAGNSAHCFPTFMWKGIRKATC